MKTPIFSSFKTILDEELFVGFAERNGDYVVTLNNGSRTWDLVCYDGDSLENALDKYIEACEDLGVRP